MMADGSRAGTLLARGGRCDAIVVCLAADGEDILTSGPGDLRVLAGAAGTHVRLIASGPLAPLPARAGPQLSGLGAGGCPGVAG